MPKLIVSINSAKSEIIVSDNISCYIISSDLPKSQIDKLVATSKMVLVSGENSLDICKKYNLDGVYYQLDCSKPVKVQLKPLRLALKNKTLGVEIPLRRHEAMLVGEVEPEFIAFNSSLGQNIDVLSWYNELFLIPSALIADSKEILKSDYDTDFMIIKSQDFKNFGC